MIILLMQIYHLGEGGWLDSCPELLVGCCSISRRWQKVRGDVDSFGAVGGSQPAEGNS